VWSPEWKGAREIPTARPIFSTTDRGGNPNKPTDPGPGTIR
jgi:hypothetical protein